MRIIALLPVFNEASTLLGVLEALHPLVDLLIIVDDGSADGSLDVARTWGRSHEGTTVLALPSNRGMSAALREGFIHVDSLLHSGALDPEDLICTLDADGQHDPKQIVQLCRYAEEQGLDVALTQRDFSLYPLHKRVGNTLMSIWGGLWARYPYGDVESGFRAMRLKVLSPLLQFYTGYRYSCAQEISVLTARLGYRVDNRFLSTIRLYRSQTGVADVLINAFFSLWAFLRWKLGKKTGRLEPTAQQVIPAETVHDCSIQK
jgi:glycosyltransferase involved in cell wall biosynthesis